MKIQRDHKAGDTWEVFAIRFASQERTERNSFLGRTDLRDDALPLDFYVWLLKSGSRSIVVDTGFKGMGNLPRKRIGVRRIDEALRALGSDPASVGDVIITHCHYDHTGNFDMFPNATFHIQAREMAYATGEAMAHEPTREIFKVEDIVALVRLNFEGRVAFADQENTVAPNVTMHWVGGHTAGLQIVSVGTERGPVVIASDASHFYDTIGRRLPFPVVHNMDDIVRSWATCKRLSGQDPTRLIPGHDPKIRQRYPAVEGFDGDVVALHLAPINWPASN